ncbi:MAG: carbon starvation CstA family protein [Planctomycetota bacterium]
MNLLVLLLLSIAALGLGGRFYSRWLARRLSENNERPTPAVVKNDNRDFVPTPMPVVFSHHFASIAGAGPILGPVMALAFGWGPAWLWVVLGAIFLGGVHDYLALHVSLREGGESIIAVMRRTMGNFAYGLMISFTILMIVLVTATFLNASAAALTSMIPLDKLNLPESQTLLRTVTVGGLVHGVVGGIASTSVIVITLFAPLLGWLYIRRKTPVWICTILALGICTLGVAVGFYLPVTLSGDSWKLCLAAYCLCASWLPVWMLLQARDFINVHILYIGLGGLLLFLGILGARGTGLELDAFVLRPDRGPGPLWPVLFVTIACGAISGFHSLCASGTASKQVRLESDGRRVGYFAMLLESLLAVCVIAAVGMAYTQADYMRQFFWTESPGNPILVYAGAVGQAGFRSVGIPVAFGTVFGMLLIEGFIVTTLDTAVRLNRYLFEELWRALWAAPPRLLLHPTVNSVLAVALMLLLGWRNSVQAIWGAFGSANQLLAALALLLFTVWLAQRGIRAGFLYLPVAFMFLTTLTMLVWLLVTQYWPRENWALVASDAALLVLAGAILVHTARHWKKFTTPSAA